MDIIDLNFIPNGSDIDHWYYLRIEQLTATGYSNFSMATQWRFLMNSNRSIGSISSREMMRRYLTGGGLWLYLKEGDKNILMVFFKSKRAGIEKTGSFYRQILYRYYKNCRLRPIIKLTPITMLADKPLKDKISDIINAELDQATDIPIIRWSRFGTFFGQGGK